MAIAGDRGEEREKVKDEISGIIRRMEAGMNVRDAFALKAMSAKPKPMPKEFSTEDNFRAHGLGIRLPWGVI